MLILAIDPGTEKSAYVLWDGERILENKTMPNEDLLALLIDDFAGRENPPQMVIEWIESYGMAVGAEVFLTCFWVGRFWESYTDRGGIAHRVPRREVKLHWCHSARAKDTNIWRALQDEYGIKGTKKNPGFFFTVAEHERQAFALASYVTREKFAKAGNE